ncbi:interferon-induced very large GTPase 1-like [Eucyclogobius newberryi]|uniref:interferon-induced very large GTPase 1-like n=1 Tax=Eucyclogobius newberryi TaxID=166745 RepID=UPI003B5BE49E
MIPAPSEDKVPPELTLVIFGDPDAVEPGPNLLLGPDKEHEPFSSMLYDLCGRVIQVFDFLGLKNTDHFPSDKGIDAFLLLLPHGHSVSQYEASVHWLKTSFGEGALNYLITVETLESKEQCEGAMADLKDLSHFSVKRCHVCSKNLRDAGEIFSLMEKIGIMVSENDSKCYRRTQKEGPGPAQGGHEENMKDQDQNMKDQDQNMKDQDQNMKDQDQNMKDQDQNREDQNLHSEDQHMNDQGLHRKDQDQVREDQDQNMKDQDQNMKVQDQNMKDQDQNMKDQNQNMKDQDQNREDQNLHSEDQHMKDQGLHRKDQDQVREDQDQHREDQHIEDQNMKDQDQNRENQVQNREDQNLHRENQVQNREDQNLHSEDQHMKDQDLHRKDQDQVREDKDQHREVQDQKDLHRMNQDPNREDQTKVTLKLGVDNNGDIADAGGSRNSSATQRSTTDEQAEERKRTGTTMKAQNALLSRLNLQKCLETKLSSAEFHQIRPSLKHDQNICESDLISVYLYKLLMLDYGARYVEAEQEPSGEKQSKEQHDNEDEDDDIFFNKQVESGAQSQQSKIHPLDLQMAVFHCSDDFLKQKIITKLSQCQYALPLLVPDPFTGDIECPLWTFREIKKTWKKTETNGSIKVITMKSTPICKAETPMVFSFRLGSLSVSKSQLINTLINDRHNTFFHRNCPGSTKSRLLFDGVVEIAWYCPAGRSSDTFTDCVAFCNLHGDGLNHDKQLKIMMDKASVNVVFVPTLKKDPVISALLKSPKPLIVLVGDDAEGAKEMKKNKYRVGIKERSLSDVSKELKKIMSDILSFTDFSLQLELTRAMATMDTGIRVDENNISCKRGFSAAAEVTKTIETTDVSRIKNMFLPCQGELWHEWGRLNKEQYRLKGHVEKEKGKKQTKMYKLRENQCKTPCSELVKSFIKHLSSLSSTEREYFLKWTQILMDAHATDCLSSILQSYDQVWSEVLDLKKKPDKSNELKSKQEELSEISKNLQSATCGLEHIFREMGQIYEAHKCLKKQPEDEKTDWSKYPELAAELMISGHPMELMDGDAGQVPITWISSLIDQVILKLGDKRVFVLSVLGIQSSGKSTMLNAMFGLQFAVSAGRCTRGAFMQLVKLSDEIREGFQWDYILVVDTEGLRALELEGNATIHRDNELATFVVGIGNMTLVNIFGENPSDMQDVLQIVVQAFMRMKKVKLSPSCVFVHQNVTDVGAAEKNMDGKRKLQDKLDQMVQLAAKEEVCAAESFSDIIEFDVQKDVKYFAQLWEGSPPMAPPNPGYSESVQELKSFILFKAKKSSGVTLSEFKTKVQDLWAALLNENFVFSFRNTLEIAVYRKLEVKYSKWTWSLRQEMLRIEEKLYTRVENGSVDQVDLKYLHGEIGKKYSEIRNDFETYFDSDKDKEMLVQWKVPFELKIKDFYDELVHGLQRKLSDVIEQKKASKELDEKKTMFEDKLLQKSKELAHQLKDKAKDENELKKQFNSVWEDLVRKLAQGTKPIENVIITNDVFSVLQQLGFESALIHNSETSKTYKDFQMHRDYSQYVCQKHPKQKQNSEEKKGKEKEGFAIPYLTGLRNRLWNFLGGPQPQDEQNQIRDHIQAVEKEALKLIKNKPVATRGYNSSYLSEVASHVKKKVEDFESNWKYSLKKEFTVDLILFVFDRAEDWISKSHAQYKKKNDFHTYLESKRNEYYNVFSSFCRGSSSAVVLAEVICEKLKTSMTEAVRNRTARDVAGHMRENYPGFKESRLNLEKHVLKSLAEKEDFKSYISYICQPQRYIETFIHEKVHDYVTGDENVSLLIKKNVEALEKFVTEALYKATEKVEEGDVRIWLQEFDNLIKEKLTAVSVSSQHFRDVDSFDFLKDAIEKSLDPIISDLKKLPPTEINEARMKPDQMLIDQLCNCCWETCPFCSAVCTNTVKDHSPDKHCVPYHRPGGVNGWHFRDTVELLTDFCTTSVASDKSFHPDSSEEKSVPYKQYQTAGGKYAEWLITPNGSMLVFWKWFVCHFQKELEDHHKRKFLGEGEIPSEWRRYNKEEAIESLEEMYNM